MQFNNETDVSMVKSKDVTEPSLPEASQQELLTSIFPNQKPMTTSKYTALYKKLDHEQTRLQIMNQLNRINPSDTGAAIATALQKGILTASKINKLMLFEQTKRVRRATQSHTLNKYSYSS